MKASIDRTILRVWIDKIRFHPKSDNDFVEFFIFTREQMTYTSAITAPETGDDSKISCKQSSYSAFFSTSVFFIKNSEDLCRRKKIINMPVNLFVVPKVPLYPLIKPV
jgi:hypothetical protein